MSAQLRLSCKPGRKIRIEPERQLLWLPASGWLAGRSDGERDAALVRPFHCGRASSASHQLQPACPPLRMLGIAVACLESRYKGGPTFATCAHATIPSSTTHSHSRSLPSQTRKLSSTHTQAVSTRRYKLRARSGFSPTQASLRTRKANKHRQNVWHSRLHPPPGRSGVP